MLPCLKFRWKHDLCHVLNQDLGAAAAAAAAAALSHPCSARLVGEHKKPVVDGCKTMIEVSRYVK